MGMSKPFQAGVTPSPMNVIVGAAADIAWARRYTDVASSLAMPMLPMPEPRPDWRSSARCSSVARALLSVFL
jgi:hypothetical protein